MDSAPICLRDSQWYSMKRVSEIAKFLDSYQDICSIKGESFKFNFTGIIVINNIPVIIFPKNYKVPKANQQKIEEAGILTRVLLRYRNEPTHEVKEKKYIFGDKENSNTRIIMAIRIIEDYKLYGYIHREQELYSTVKKGKMEWAKTIHRTIPSINHGRVVYGEPIMKSRQDDKYNLICKIHRYIVADAVKMWGWLIGIQSNHEMAEMAMPCADIEAVALLQLELKKVYINREIALIKMMISYLNAKLSTEGNNNKEILGTKYFSFIWEAICGYMFYNKYSTLKDLVPQPEWESDIIMGKISQRPDVFSIYKETLYILDAKYYNFNNNLPGWHDVVKQLFYRHTVKLNLKMPSSYKILPKNTQIKNVFIFPGSEDMCIQYIGRVFVKGIDDLGEIKAFAINQRIAMKIYAYGNGKNYRDEVIQQLSEQC